MKQNYTVLIPARNVTPKYILEIKKKYNLSWADMDKLMHYAPYSKAAYHACKHSVGKVNPKTDTAVHYLNDNFAKRFSDMVARLEKERGHTYEVVSMIKRIPKLFGIAGEPRRCKGHDRPTFELPKSGYCNEECRALYLAKQLKRKG